MVMTSIFTIFHTPFLEQGKSPYFSLDSFIGKISESEEVIEGSATAYGDFSKIVLRRVVLDKSDESNN